MGEHMRRPLAAAALVALAIAVWFGLDWYRARDASLSEMPPKIGTAFVLVPRDSVILASLAITFPTIETALNAAAASLSGRQNGSEEIKCVKNDFPRIKECLTVNWEINYRQSGRITVGRESDKIRVTLPLQFSGKGGFGGSIAEILRLNDKNVDGSFTVSASVGIALDDRFCPVVVPGDIAFGWQNEGRIELIGRNEFRILGIGFDVGPWSLDIGRHFNGQIRDALHSALANAGQWIPCEPIRAELQKAWRSYAIPVTVEPDTPPMFVNIDPVTVGTSGLIVEDGGVRLMAQVAARAVVAAEKGSEASKGDLPVRQTVDPGRGRLDIAVPIKVPFALLETEATKALRDKPITLRTGGKDILLTVDRVDVYPSGEQIAVGLGFSAKLPWRFFDAHGTVWVTGRPVVEPGGKAVHLEQVAVTRQVDNPLWSALSVALEDVVNAQVQKAARYDLSSITEDAIKRIEEAVSDPAETGGVRFHLLNPKIRLGQIALEEQNLAVEGLFEAQWDASFDTIAP
jgi:hypothetical protein